jgi:transposase
VLDWRHEHENDAAGLVRRAAARLGAEATGLETAGYRRGAGVTEGAVSQWLKRGREQGVEGLRRHPAPGRQPRLTPEQFAQIPALLEAGAEASGFRGQIWTCQRVAEVIRRTYDVTYHPAHVSRLLHAVRHSVQRPRTRATQRNEEAIQAWWQERWPALEKKRSQKSAPSSG